MPPLQRAICKGHLASTGINYNDLDRPIIGVVNSWNEIVPGHIHLRTMADWVKKGVLASGGYPLEFNTIAVCDGIAQGHAGMFYSLPSREVIADSIEIMVRAHDIFDGLVFISSCDKIVPGMLMAAARLNLPAIFVTGGPMTPFNTPRESKMDRKNFLQGQIDEETLVTKIRKYYPGPGACPFLGTANTMMIMTEVLGCSLPDMALTPANSANAFDLARVSGAQIVKLVRSNIKPRDILTRDAFLNAITVVSATGASLNTVLHLPAVAEEANIKLSLDDFQNISEQTPYLVSVAPNDLEYTVDDIHRAGGIPALLNNLGSLIKKNVLTVTGKPLGSNIIGRKVSNPRIIHSLQNPIATTGGINVLKGTLAPRGAVVKTSAVASQDKIFSGPARVFESMEEAIIAVKNDNIVSGDVVIVRNEGPRGGPGMRELHRLTEILAFVPHVAIVTDGRFSGASTGLAIGYVTPEAAQIGPIALVREGDNIDINIFERRLDIKVDPAVLEQRQKDYVKSNKKPITGCLATYSAHVGDATDGALLRFKTRF